MASAEATSIYSPQQASEQQTIDATLANTKLSLDNSTTNLNTSYANSMTGEQKSELNQGQNADFAASKAGLYGSGIAANAKNVVTSNYNTAVGQLNTDRNNKLDAITSERNLAQTTHDQASSALVSKYQSEMNLYDQQQAQYQAQINKENQILAAQSAAARGGSSYGSSGGSSGGGGGGGSSQFDYNGSSVGDFVNALKSQFNAGTGKGQANWGQVASAVQSKYGKIATGSNMDQALHLLYTGRA